MREWSPGTAPGSAERQFGKSGFAGADTHGPRIIIEHADLAFGVPGTAPRVSARATTLHGCDVLEYSPGKELKTVDPVLTRIFQEIRTIYAPADFPVVIQGETGTGKEGVARALHWHSPQRNAPFVAVNCGAIPEGLIDSEFFGHERGAFSGAIVQRKGHFEMADGGTLFLDEIGEMPMSLQARLLRVLQEGEVVRVGSSRPIPVDVRVVAATNGDLRDLVDQGKFRADLYYRIAAAVVHVPPLRERPHDITMLARAFVGQRGAEGSPAIRLQSQVARVFRSFPWPGNVRELQGLISVARARAVAQGRRSIGVGDLPSGLSGDEIKRERWDYQSGTTC